MSASHVESTGTLVLAAVLFIVPLAYCSAFADPFGLVKRFVMLAAALALWGLALVPTGAERPRLVSPASALGFVLLASAAVACCVAVNRGLALWGLLDLAVGVGLMLGTARFARDLKDVSLLLRTTLIAAALVALGSILQVFIPAASTGWLSLFLPPNRGGSTVGDPGLAVQFLVIALPLGAGAVALSSDVWRHLCGGLVGIVAAGIVFIGRPEGWAASLLALGLLVLARVVQVAGHGGRWSELAPDPGGASLRAFLIAGIVVAAVVSLSRLTILYPSQKPVEPLSGTALLAPTTADAATDRAAAAPATRALIMRHPLGVGPADFRHAFLEVAWTKAPKSPFSLSHQAVHAGNAYMELTAETGILGGLACALLVLLLTVQAFVATARAAPPWDGVGSAALAAMGTLAGVAFLGAPFQEPPPALLFWVTAGIIQTALLRSGTVPGVPRILMPRARPASPGRGPGSRAGYAWGALFIAAVVGLGLCVFDRARASTQTLDGQGAFFSGRYEAALLAFGQPSARRSPEHLPRALAASSYLRLGFYDQAAREFGETMRRSPHFISAYLGRAAARQAQGLWDLADDDYRTALKIWPDNAEIYQALADLDTARGRLDDALDDYRRVMQINPDLADTYFKMGEVFMRRNQFDEAIEAYQVCAMKSPKYPRMRLRQGDAFFQKGLQDMALRYYQAAAADDDKDVQARLRIANTMHALGRFCEAKTSLEAARDLESDRARRDLILDLIKKVEPDCAAEDPTLPGRKKPSKK